LNKDRPFDKPLNKGSLQRKNSAPPPPPKPALPDPFAKDPPSDDSNTRNEPPLRPGAQVIKDRTKKQKLLLRSLKVFFFFFSPLGILAGVWAFFINDGDDKPAVSPPVTVETTIAPETSSVVTTESPSLEPATESIDADWERIARSVVLIYLPGCDGESWSHGSGTIVLDGGHVLTNEHVSGESSCGMQIYAIDSIKDSPVFISYAERIPNASDQGLDLSVIRLIDEAGRPTKAEGRTPIEIEQGEIDLGTSIKVLGFPAMGGDTISMTTGEHSGWMEGLDDWTGEFYKTSAKMGPGVSGGAAFEAETGRFIGIPTGGSGDGIEGDILGLVRPSRYALPLLEVAERAN